MTKKATVIFKMDEEIPTIIIKGRSFYNVYSGSITLNEALRDVEKDQNIEIKKLKIFYKST